MNEETDNPHSLGDVKRYHMFTVMLTLNNGKKTYYVDSMEGVDKDKAKQIALNRNWISGVKSVDNVFF